MVKPVTAQEVRKATRWFQKRMGITDWRVSLHLQDEPPTWKGDCPSSIMSSIMLFTHSKRATMWVSNVRALSDGVRPLANVFHELAHLVAEDIGLGGTVTDHIEYAWSRYGDICCDLYERETKGRKK